MNKPVAPHVLHRIRAEYLEMPGLTLKPEQVQRLCCVDRAACEAALAVLVDSGFLSVRTDGGYGRFKNSEATRRRPAKARLEPRVRPTASPVRTRAS